jgi:hypothetical protein
MKYPKKHMYRLKDALSAAHQSKAETTLPVDSLWRQNVMQSVRRNSVIRKETNHRLDFSLLAWRLAPAALALMILLGVMIFRIEDTLDYQLAGLMMSDPVQTYITIEPL